MGHIPSSDVRSKARYFPPAALVLLVVLWCWPMTLRGRVPAGDEITTTYLPLMASYSRALDAGRVPVWNERANLGTPVLAEGRAGVYYPPHRVLYRLFGPWTAYAVSLVVHWTLAGLWAYACARGFQIGRAGALLAGIVFAGQGFFVGHLTQPWSYTTGCWLPLVLLAVWRWLEDEAWEYLVALSGALALLLLAGHFQIAVYALLTVFVICLGHGISGIRTPVRTAFRLTLLAVAMIGGLALASVQLVPTAELSVVADWRGRGQLYVSSFAFPLLQIVNYLAPTFLSSDVTWGNVIWSNWRSSYAECLAYIGLVPLALAIWSIWFCRNERSVRFLTAIVLFALLASILPCFAATQVGSLPGFAWLTAPARWSIVAGLGLALLAGRALETIDADRFAGWCRRFVPCVAVLAFIAIAIVCQRFARIQSAPRGIEGEPASWPFDTLVWELAFPAVNLAVLGLGTFVLSRFSQRRALAGLILVWSAVDLTIFGQVCSRVHYEPHAPVTAKSPFLATIADHTQGRIWGSTMDMPLLVGAQPMTNQSIPDMEQYWHERHVSRKHWWTGAFTTIPAPDRWGDRGLHVGRITAMLDKNDIEFMRLTGMRFLTHGLDDRGPLQDEYLDRIAATEDQWLSEQFLGSSGKPAPEQRQWTLWALKPSITSARAWLFPVTDPPTPGTDPRAVTREPPFRRGLLDQAVPLSDVTDEGDRLTVRGSLESPAVLVLSDLFYPGWIATVQQYGARRSAAIERAFGRMRGVSLEQPGDFEVVFSYEPESHEVGARISIVACAVWLVCLIAVLSARRAKRRRAPPVDDRAAESVGKSSPIS